MVTKNVRNAELPVILENESDMNAPLYGDDADTESAWQQWGEDLKSANVKGVIRIAKVPMLDDGSGPNLTKKGQVQLFAVPHDQYGLDELLDVVRQKYMKPGETIAIRITGMRQSGTHAGVVPFNRIVMVSRALESAAPSHETSNLGEVLKAMREAQEAQVKFMQDVLARRPEPEKESKTSALETIQVIAGIVTPLLTPVIAGLMSRPKPQSDIGQMIDALSKLKGMTDGSSAAESDDSSLGGIIKAVAPSALQALSSLAQIQMAKNVTQAPRPMLAAPNPAPRVAMPPPAQPIAPVVSTDPPAPAAGPPMPAAGLTPEMQAMIPVLTQTIDQCVTIAAAGGDPKETAQLLSDMLPETYDEQLYKLVETPASFKRLALLDSRVNDHAAFFEALRVALLALYTADDEPSAPSLQS